MKTVGPHRSRGSSLVVALVASSKVPTVQAVNTIKIINSNAEIEIGSTISKYESFWQTRD